MISSLSPWEAPIAGASRCWRQPRMRYRDHCGPSAPCHRMRCGCSVATNSWRSAAICRSLAPLAEGDFYLPKSRRHCRSVLRPMRVAKLLLILCAAAVAVIAFYEKYERTSLAESQRTLATRLAAKGLRQGQPVFVRQAPEGFYQVTSEQLNPNSRHHLSFNLGFPNAFDP